MTTVTMMVTGNHLLPVLNVDQRPVKGTESAEDVADWVEEVDVVVWVVELGSDAAWLLVGSDDAVAMLVEVDLIVVEREEVTLRVAVLTDVAFAREVVGATKVEFVEVIFAEVTRVKFAVGLVADEGVGRDVRVAGDAVELGEEEMLENAEEDARLEVRVARASVASRLLAELDTRCNGTSVVPAAEDARLIVVRVASEDGSVEVTEGPVDKVAAKVDDVELNAPPEELTKTTLCRLSTP